MLRTFALPLPTATPSAVRATPAESVREGHPAVCALILWLRTIIKDAPRSSSLLAAHLLCFNT